MSAHLNDFLKSGKKILEDTKAPAPPKKKAVTGLQQLPEEKDPHKILVKRVIQEKPKKMDLVVEFKRFITASEAL